MRNQQKGSVIELKTHCYVRACKRIIERALQLNPTADNPVAIFSTNLKSKRFSYIDDVHISTILQEAAAAVHNITKKEELKRFTSHSIRVGACVLLHSQNISTEDIKFRLRWRSDSFRMYLRNIIQLAEKHKNAVADCVKTKT